LFFSKSNISNYSFDHLTFLNKSCPFTLPDVFMAIAMFYILKRDCFRGKMLFFFFLEKMDYDREIKRSEKEKLTSFLNPVYQIPVSAHIVSFH